MELSFRLYLEIADGVYVYGLLVDQYSVQQYCQNQLAKTGTDEVALALKDMCKTMLYYGAASQDHFNAYEDDMAKAGVADDARIVWGEDLLDVDVTIHERAFVVRHRTVIANNGKTLKLEDAIKMNFYTGYNGDPTGGAELLIWDSKKLEAGATLNEGNVTDRMPMTKGSKYKGFYDYSAASNGVPTKHYGDVIFVCGKFTNAAGESVYSTVFAYSAEIYAANQLVKADATAELKELCLRMVTYGEAAKYYFSIK